MSTGIKCSIENNVMGIFKKLSSKIGFCVVYRFARNHGLTKVVNGLSKSISEKLTKDGCDLLFRNMEEILNVFLF